MWCDGLLWQVSHATAFAPFVHLKASIDLTEIFNCERPNSITLRPPSWHSRLLDAHGSPGILASAPRGVNDVSGPIDMACLDLSVRYRLFGLPTPVSSESLKGGASCDIHRTRRVLRRPRPG